MEKHFLTQAERKEHDYNDLTAPAVYCSTYGKYNSGSLDGAWIDLTTFINFADFQEFLYNLHADEDDPEFMFQDFENFPRIWYSESGLNEETFNRIQEYAELEFDEQDAFREYLENYDRTASVQEFRDRDQGIFDDEEDFAWHIFEECYAYDLPDFAKTYFDVKAFARDLFMCDYDFCGDHVISRY